MDSKDKKLVVLLLSVSFTMLIAGYYFVPFVVHIWTYIANLAGEKDTFLACILLIYFVIFSLVGWAIGLLLYAYGNILLQCFSSLVKKIVNLLMDMTKKADKK